MGHGWVSSCLLGGNISLSLFSFARPAWWQSRREGEGERRERCLTQCTTSSTKRSEECRRSARIAVETREITPGRLAFAVQYAVPQCPAAGGKRASRAPSDLGSGVDATIGCTAAEFPGFPWVVPRFLVSDRPRGALLRASPVLVYIYTYESTASGKTSRVRNRPRIYVRARGTGSGEISDRSTSRKYQPVPWLQ